MDYFKSKDIYESYMKKNIELGNYMDYQLSNDSFYFTNDQMFRMKYFLTNLYEFK